MSIWHAVHTHVRAENKAVYNLQRQGYEAYAPQYLKRRSHARRIEHVPAPLFPRYIFVGLESDVTPWRSIQSTFGVSYIVCNGDKPAPMPEGIVESILARRNENGLVNLLSTSAFEKGQSVQVINGAFSDQIGLIESVTDGERVVILLNMLGGWTKVRLPTDSVVATV
jgi:transcriptional antiterminator RfaH